MYSQFEAWCAKNEISIYPNEEMFFMTKTLVIRPDYRLLNKVFIDLIRPEEINEVYLNGCSRFAEAEHGVLVVIPTDILGELDTVTKQQVEERFGITL